MAYRRLSHPDLQPDHALSVSASAIKPEGWAFIADGMKDFVTPRALETTEIDAMVRDYRRASERSREAGLDGVEIHSTNNYLLDEFLCDSTDQYGGSVRNRLRFPLRVVQAVVAAWEPYRVGIRVSAATPPPADDAIDSSMMETYGAYIAALDQFGLAYLPMIEGMTIGPRACPQGVDIQALRHRFRGAWMANNGCTPDMAAAASVTLTGRRCQRPPETSTTPRIFSPAALIATGP